MRTERTGNGGRAGRVYDRLRRRRGLVVGCLLLGVLAGAAGTLHMRMDMSFRPVFTGDDRELARTAAFERTFGDQGFNDLVVIADVGSAADPATLGQAHALADRLRALPRVTLVRDPLTFPFYDRAGRLHADGVEGELARARTAAERQAVVDAVLQSAPARRIVFGDGGRQVAVTASFDIPNASFSTWHSTVGQVRAVVRTWGRQTGIATQVTGYPAVEQVYAHEVLVSVLRSIAVLLVIMLVILFIYFRRIPDVVTCLAGVTLSVPLVLGVMTLLGQPFSIVNSQVLTLVLIVGIAEALHHQQEYRRRREAGRDHRTANREAFTILAWPAFMTGLATTAGFAALLTAKMTAISSFGLSTALSVVIVYLVNWLTVPALIDLFYRNTPATEFRRFDTSATETVLRRADGLVQRRPWTVVTAFVLGTAVLGLLGATGLSIDQKVNEELPKSHPAVRAQATYERQFAGFLGPQLTITPRAGTVVGLQTQLAALVNRICAMPQVRFVASPLDLVAQPPATAGRDGSGCERRPGDLRVALAARQGRAGADIRSFAESVLSQSGDAAAIVIRVPDIGTARSLPFAHQVLAAARQSVPDADVRLVGEWWLAQQGMHSLSFEMMLSAVTALALILPVMWFAIRDRRLFLAGIVPTVLPVFATLGFMGLTHITVRIGTAMILAIALGLAADDTIHLSVRIADRVRAGSDPASAVNATLLRTGRPASFSSYVLIGGFASMMASSLVALREMGMVAAFTMAFALATDLLLGPALYLLLARGRSRRDPVQAVAGPRLEKVGV
ncbi:RND family transporter [Frankia sp. AiPa1]|uniref:efflux RND transporter permease subunit n=1 Tax=Frankia sp. AiPa1 TaxID=573492 RepID=UPI00202B3BAD|nr:MMPL family transporter [Frankia sp. AiPa1]MCL9760301.1 MMPL family transporter [Frankia sp. AiPa1]